MQLSHSLKTYTLLFCFSVSVSTFAQTFKSINEVKGLPVGSKVKMFSTVDVSNNTWRLSDALKKGPVVLLFYRGQWCPVCNRHLSQLQDSLQQIYDKGATVIAISPEKQENMKKTAAKTKATFTLLYDKDYSIGEAFDVVYKPPVNEIMMYNQQLDADLENANTDNSERLPVPATFIINKNGIIVWRQFNPDYSIRASVSDILKHLADK